MSRKVAASRWGTPKEASARDTKARLAQVVPGIPRRSAEQVWSLPRQITLPWPLWGGAVAGSGGLLPATLQLIVAMLGRTQIQKTRKPG